MRQPVSPQQLKRMREEFIKSQERKPYRNGEAIDFGDVKRLTMARNMNKLYFHVPTEKCVWGYGWRYSKAEHPFVNFYSQENSLDQFYGNYCPQNILEALTLDESLRNHPFNIIENPWVGTLKGKKITQVIKAKGMQHYGPLPPNSLSKEKKRLKLIKKSIAIRGYDPNKYAALNNDYIHGYFLVKDDDFLFWVVNGQHRAAALVAENHETLPVTFSVGIYTVNRIISEWHLNFLAGTAYDEKDLPTVKTIFNAYFDETLREKRKQALASWMAIAEAKAQQVQPTTLVEF